jgi:hypothetical protein
MAELSAAAAAAAAAALLELVVAAAVATRVAAVVVVAELKRVCSLMCVACRVALPVQWICLHVWSTVNHWIICCGWPWQWRRQRSSDGSSNT